ncbi:MAG: hypothetical protein BWY74_02709 [Firmicutes bacterium ADurb.Bin419]|nr:MAG: hypothetical protein BWY74_02709 [Firmicutes bacterium ADurb.Bin419]
MENSYSKIVTSSYSLLWPDERSYECWKETVTPSVCFYKDLNINKVIDVNVK